MTRPEEESGIWEAPVINKQEDVPGRFEKIFGFVFLMILLLIHIGVLYVFKHSTIVIIVDPADFNEFADQMSNRDP